MKKYRIEKKDNSTNLWILQERVCILFWRSLAKISYTYFNLYLSNEEYNMNEFLKRFGLLICTLLGGCAIVFAYVVLVPVIGEWLKTIDADNKWIALSVVSIIGVACMLVYRAQQNADEEWLKREEGEGLGFYKDED